MNVIAFAVALFRVSAEVATDLGKDRRKVPDRECPNTSAAVLCSAGQPYTQIVSELSASSNVLHGALRLVMPVDVIITYRYRVKDKTSAKQLPHAGAVTCALNGCCATA
jgi:hypothetical protein